MKSKCEYYKKVIFYASVFYFSRYQSLFKANEKTSLYLQSKVVRAKERLDHELTADPQKKSQKPKEDISSGNMT